MAITPYSPIAQQPLINTYVPLPYDDLLKAGLSKQAQYNAGEAATGALEDELLKISNLPQDTPGRDQYINEIKGKLASKLEEYGTDYSKMLPYTKQLAKQVKKDFLYGKPAAMQKNLASYQSYVKDLDERLKAKTITQDDYDYFKNRAFNEYQGIGEKNAEGNYKSLNTITPANYVDVDKLALERANGWVATQLKSGKWKHSSVPGYFEKEDGTGVTFEEVYSNIYDSLASDESVSPYLQQQYEKENYLNKSDYGTTYTDPLTGLQTTYRDPNQGRFFNEKVGQAAKLAAEKESRYIPTTKELRDNRLDDQLKRAKIKALQEDEIKSTTVTPPVTTNKNNNPLKGTPLGSFVDYSTEYTKAGNPIFRSNGTAKWAGVIEVAKGSDGKYKAIIPADAKGIDVNKTKEFAELLNYYEENIPALKGKTPQQMVAIVAQARENSQAFTTPNRNLEGIEAKKVDDQLQRLASSDQLELNIPGDPTPRTNDEVLKELGLTKEDLKTLKVSNLNPSIGGYTVTVIGEDKQPKTVAVSGVKEMNDVFAIQRASSKAERESNFNPQVVQTNKGVFVTQTNIGLNQSTQKWENQTGVYQVAGMLSDNYIKSLSKPELDKAIKDKQIVKLGPGKYGQIVPVNYDHQEEANRASDEWLNSKYMEDKKGAKKNTWDIATEGGE